MQSSCRKPSLFEIGSVTEEKQRTEQRKIHGVHCGVLRDPKKLSLLVCVSKKGDLN
jgi:hypothetical protein